MIKNLKIKMIFCVAIIITIISLAVTVNAFSVSMKLDSSSKLKAGEIVTVTLKISNIDAGDGIDAIVGTLNYDKDVFEEVTEDNFEGINKWNVNIYDMDSQIFTITRSSKVNMVSDVIKISLKVKDTISKDSATITLDEITASGGAVDVGGTGDIEIQKISVVINKETTNPPAVNEIANEIVNETTNEITNEVTNEVVNNTLTNQIKGNTNNNSNTAGGKLPQTGENAASIIAGVSIISVIAIVAFIKYRNLNIK